MAERGSIDLSDFTNKLKNLFPGIESDEVYPQAVRKGAEYLAGRLAENTPVGVETYTRKGKTHAPGTAKRSVIVYRRKNKSLMQAEVNASLSFLVGYEKRAAYYMYWYEYGRKGQPARPVIRPVFDSGIDEAMRIALEHITRDHEQRLAK